MIMTSAVEARTHAVAPVSIAIHFTCDEHNLRFPPDRGMIGPDPVALIIRGFRHQTASRIAAIRNLPETDACLRDECHHYHLPDPFVSFCKL
jgi:hypothetical protein